MKRLVILSISVLFILACKKDNKVEPTYFGYNYAGYQLGKYVVYQVDSIIYDGFFSPVKIDTISYQIKEVLEETYTSVSGEKGLKLVRYKRDNDTLNWQIKDVWHCFLPNKKYEVVEENVNYLKLIFPIKTTVQWDGNIKNSASEQLYFYKNLHQPLEINGLTFDSTLTVVQQQNQNLVDNQYFYEKYATKVGLIEKSHTDTYSQINNQTGNWEIEDGYIYKMRVIAYGK